MRQWESTLRRGTAGPRDDQTNAARVRERDGLGYRYNYRLLRKSWLERKLEKLRRTRQLKVWRDEELATYGMSMRGVCHGTRIEWE